MATFPLHYRHTREAATSRRLKKRIHKDIPEYVGPTYRDLSLALERDRTVYRLIARDGDRCYLCQRTFPPATYEIEHIIPCSKGGTDDLYNLGIACRMCNRWKHTRYVSITVAQRMPCFW